MRWIKEQLLVMATLVSIIATAPNEARAQETPELLLMPPDSLSYSQTKQLTDAAEPAFHSGEVELARRIVLHFANLPDERERKRTIDDLGHVRVSLSMDDERPRADAFARFLYDTLKDHPLAQTPAFLPVSNSASAACGKREDKDCLRETAMAGLRAAGGIPETRPERDYERALTWWARSLVFDEKFEEADRILPLIRPSAVERKWLREALIDRVELSFHAGDTDEARQTLLRIAQEPGNYSDEPDLSRLGMVLYALDQEGELARGVAFARFAFDVLKDHPISRSTQFLQITNPLSKYCGARGDLECLDKASALGLQAIGGVPDERPEFSHSVTLMHRAIALVAQGRLDEAAPILKVQSYTEFARGIIMAEDIMGLGFDGTLAGSLKIALYQAALKELERKTQNQDRSQIVFTVWQMNSNLASELWAVGRLVEAEQAYRRAYAIALEHFEPDARGTIDAAASLGDLLSEQGRWDEAAAYYERNWEIALSYDDWTLELETELGGWVRLLLETGRLDEADRITEEVWREARARGGLTDYNEPAYASLRGAVLLRQNRIVEAEALFRHAYELVGNAVLMGGASYNRQLAQTIEMQGRMAEAEPLRRKVIETAANNILDGTFSGGRIDAWMALADNLTAQGKHDEAGTWYEKALTLARALEEPSQQTLGIVAQGYARHLLEQGNPAEAAEYAKIAMTSQALQLDLLGSGAGETAYLEASRRQRGVAMLTIEALLGAGPLDEADHITLFEAAQRAQASSASSAMSQKVAETLAQNAGAGEVVELWGKAQRAVASLDKQLVLLGSGGDNIDVQRLELTTQREVAFARLQRIEGELEEQFPRFFDLARPAPAGLAMAQDALADDEALVVLVPSDDPETDAGFAGMVIAVSRQGVAAAQLAIAPAELTRLIKNLHTGLSESGSGYTQHPEFDAPDVLYSRREAFALHNALFSDDAIASIIAEKPQWTLASQGSLVSVSFAALVTQAPEGGDSGDTDPDALRATNWLGMERILAVTPSVAALTLARNTSATPVPASQPFFGFGDPAFSGKAGKLVKLPDELRERALLSSVRAPADTANYYRGKVADLDALAKLDRLPGTALEVETLAAVLGAGSDSIATQLAATEANVKAQSASGKLADTQIIVFATHGLIAGEGGLGLAEPALALTPPAGVAQGDLTSDNDGLLTASEAATLQLTADWLILSACNTSAGSSAKAQGLSGLARGFLYAGARSLLVSHFPVSDRAMPLLTTTAVVARRELGMSRAEALREAQRRMISDTRDDHQGQSLAHPKAWAALTLISPSR